MALEKVLTFYGEIFDRESCRRRRKILKYLCECVLHQSDHTPQKRKRIYI
uniref:PIPO n=1 Tax=Blue squill virus A TaxID=1072517 RepID=G9HZB9_9POTV|nr:PIPO [Blue squill virus A]